MNCPIYLLSYTGIGIGIYFLGFSNDKIKDAAYFCPKAFAFSVLLTVLCAGYTVYTVFIYDSHAIYFAGLAEFFAQLGSIVLSVAALIMVIIVWAIALQRIKKHSKYE